ncbi:MAG: WYL domain-containing protein, partial [Ginsengibacter sp.]
EQGVPISFEANRGYFIVQGYFLPPVSFSSEEANAFLLMEFMIPAFGDKSIQTHYSSALQKIRSVLRGSQKDQLEFLDSNIKMQVPKRLKNDHEFLSPLQNCIAEKTIVKLEYKNNNEEVSSRSIEPIGLIFYAFSWHLIAFCHLRKAYRDFKISRIISIMDTHKPFEKSDHVSLNDFMSKLPVDY